MVVCQPKLCFSKGQNQSQSTSQLGQEKGRFSFVSHHCRTLGIGQENASILWRCFLPTYNMYMCAHVIFAHILYIIFSTCTQWWYLFPLNTLGEIGKKNLFS